MLFNAVIFADSARLLVPAQVLMHMKQLGARHTLLCDLSAETFQVNTANLDIVLGSVSLVDVLEPPEEPLFSGRPCFTDAQCRGCFPNTDWLTPEIGCSNATSRCAVSAAENLMADITSP